MMLETPYKFIRKNRIYMFCLRIVLIFCTLFGVHGNSSCLISSASSAPWKLLGVSSHSLHVFHL